jgi:hypothetical protein
VPTRRCSAGEARPRPQAPALRSLPARQRGRRRALWALALAVLTAISAAGIAYAAFASTTSNGSNAVTATTLTPPTGLTGTPAGRNVSLAWSAATPATGYDIQGAAPASGSSSCGGLTFTAVSGANPTTTTTSYTDTNRAAPSGTTPTPPAIAHGRWYCYRALTRYNVWASPTTSAAVAVRVGVVATGITITNAANTAGCGSSGVSGALDCGDQVVITFNQAINTATGPAASNTVCGQSNGTTLLLASTTTSGGCNTGTEQVNVGRLTTPQLTNSGRYAASYAWSAGNTVLTITLGSRVAGNRNVEPDPGTTTLTPSTDTADLQSSSGAVHACHTNTGGGDCLPTTTNTW